MSAIHRREVLALAAGAVVFAASPFTAGPAQAANDAAEAIKAFAGGREPIKGKIAMDLPEIAENGNTVPLTLVVDSPMTKDSHVTDVLVLAEGNPNSGVAKLAFSPLSGKAEAALRIRLAATQNVVAVAKMNDGSVFIEKKLVKVTIGGCGG